MRYKILSCLRARDDFVSGQKICEELGVSRTAVWKYITALRDEGYEIESVTRRGYRLISSPDVITEDELYAHLGPDGIKGRICYYDKVDSTNEAAKRAAAEGAPEESFFVADCQTAGKGRRGRTWLSPGGEDIFFSILLRPDIPVQSASMLTILAALAGAETAAAHSGEVCRIKWPNDVILHDRKICGILTEMALEMNEIGYVIVGAGFNLNRMQFDDEIADMAGSIKKETGRQVDRAAFFADFVRSFISRYHRFLLTESLAPFVDEYNAVLINKGRQVKLVKNGHDLIRRAEGINELGELIVIDEDGRPETVFAGEVSVRGLYGYL